MIFKFYTEEINRMVEIVKNIPLTHSMEEIEHNIKQEQLLFSKGTLNVSLYKYYIHNFIEYRGFTEYIDVRNNAGAWVVKVLKKIIDGEIEYYSIFDLTFKKTEFGAEVKVGL